MSHPQSAQGNNNLPQGDCSACCSNEINTHQVHQAQNPVNTNMPIIPTMVPSQLMQYPVAQQPPNIPPPVQGQPLALYAYPTIMLQPNYGYQPASHFLTGNPPNIPASNPINTVPNVPQSLHYNQPETVAQAPPNPIPPPVIPKNTVPCKKKSRPHALTSIVNPQTGENVAKSIYQEVEAESYSESTYSEYLQIGAEYASDVSREETPTPESEPITPESSPSVKHTQPKSPSVNPKSPPKNYQSSTQPQPQYTFAPNNAQTTVIQSRIQPNSSHQHSAPQSSQHSISTCDQSCNQYYDSYQHYPQPVAVNPQYQAPPVNILNQIPQNYPQQVVSNVPYNQNAQWINQQSSYAGSHQQHYSQVNYQQPISAQPQNYPMSDQVYNRNNQAYGMAVNTHGRSSTGHQRLPEAYPRRTATNYQHDLTAYSRESSHARNQLYNLPVHVNHQHSAYRNTQQMVQESSQTAIVYHQTPAPPNNCDQTALISSQQYVSATHTQQTVTATSPQVVISHTNQQTYPANSQQNILHNYYRGAAPNIPAQQILPQYRLTGQEQLPQDSRKPIPSPQSSVNTNQNLPAPNYPPQQANYQLVPIPVQDNQRTNQQPSCSLPESNYQAPINQINQYQSTRKYHHNQNRRNEGYSKSKNNSNQRTFSGQSYSGDKPPAAMSSTPQTTILKHSAAPEVEPNPVKVQSKSYVTFQDNTRPENIHSHNASTSYAASRSFHRNMGRMSQYPQPPLRPPRPSNPQYQSYSRGPHAQSLPAYNSGPRECNSVNTGTIYKQSGNLNVSFALTNKPVSPTTHQDAPRTILGRPEQGSDQQIKKMRQSLSPNFTYDSEVQKSLENTAINPPERLAQNDQQQQQQQQQQQSFNLKQWLDSSETSVATSSGSLKNDSTLIIQPSEKEKSLPEPVVEKTNERPVNINVPDAPQTSKSSTPVAINQQEVKQNQPEKIPSLSSLDTAGSIKIISSGSTTKNEPKETKGDSSSSSTSKEIKKDSQISVKSKDLSVDSQKSESQSKLSYSSILAASGSKTAPTPAWNDLVTYKKVENKDTGTIPKTSKPLDGQSNFNREQQTLKNTEDKLKKSKSKSKKKNRYKYSDSEWSGCHENDFTTERRENYVETPMESKQELNEKSLSSLSNTSTKSQPVSSNKLQEPVVESKQFELDKKSSSSPNNLKETRPVSVTGLQKETVELKQVESDKKSSSSSSPNNLKETRPGFSTGQKQTVELIQVESDEKSSASTSKETRPVSSTEIKEQTEESKTSKVNKPPSISSGTPNKIRVVPLSDLQEQPKNSKQLKAEKKSASGSKKNRAGPWRESQEKSVDSIVQELDQKPSTSSNTSKKIKILSASEIKKQIALSEAEQLALNLEPLSLFRDFGKKKKTSNQEAVELDQTRLHELEVQLQRIRSYSPSPPPPSSSNTTAQLIPSSELQKQASEDPEKEEKREILEEFLEDPLNDALKDTIFPQDHQIFQVLVDQNKEIVIDEVYDVYTKKGMSKFRAEVDEKSQMSDPQLIKSFFLQKFTFLSPSQIDNLDTVKESAEIVSEVVITPKITADKNESDVKYYNKDVTITSKIVLDDPGFKICTEESTADKSEEISQLEFQKNEKNLLDHLECNPETPIHIIPEYNIEKNIESKPKVEDNVEESEVKPPEETLSSNSCSIKIIQYSREFLIRLRNSPYSKIRPSNLPDMEVINHKSNYEINYSTPVNLRAFPEPSFKVPEYFNPFSFRQFSSKTILPSRANTPEIKVKSSEPPMIYFKLSQPEDVALRKIKNAWKPSFTKNNSSEAGDRENSESVYKKVRSVLNKLTPEKFAKLVGQIKDIEIENEEALQKIIDLVFNKAIAEPNFAVGYASMCNELSHLKIRNSNMNDKKNFRQFLIDRCQAEFEKAAFDEAIKQQKLEEIKRCTDPEEKKKLQLSLEEYDYQIRKRSVGIVKFIGELFKNKMLTQNIMQKCMSQLLSTPDEERLECLCKLLTTIGKLFEEKISLEIYIKQLKNLAKQNTEYKISSRIRFMIQDVVELRLNNWVSRRSDSNPTTMDQLQRDVEQEERKNRNDRTPYQNRQQNDRITPQSTSRNEDLFTPKETYSNRQRGYLNSGRRNSRASSRPESERRSPSKPRTGINLSIKPQLEDTNVLGNRNAYIWNKTPAMHTPTETYNPYSLLDTPNLTVDRDRLSVNITGTRSAGPKEYRSNSSWRGRSSYSSTHSQSSSLKRESLSIKTISPSIQSTKNLFQPEFKSQSSLPFVSSSKSSSNSSNVSNKLQKTGREEEAKDYSKVFNDILDCCYNSTDAAFIKDIEDVLNELETSAFARFLQETTLRVFEDSCSKVLTRYSLMLSHMIKIKFISFLLFQTEYQKLLETVDDMILDIPHCLTHISQLLLEMLISGLHPFAELKQTLSSLKNKEHRRKILGELLSLLRNSQGSEWLVDKWSKSELLWTDFVDLNGEQLDGFINMYKLDCLVDVCNNPERIISSTELSLTEIQNHLVGVLSIDDFDNVVSWISVNVGARSKHPQFVRNLVTSILRISIEQNGESWKLNEEMFNKLLKYIQRYVDANFQLELQCLYAIQAYIHELQHPQGVLARIVSILCTESIIADETFLAWRESTEETEVQGRGTVISALRSFFENLSLLLESDKLGDKT
ncbi:uncharacterized protein LOC123275371 isoform X2 [Cotesia glomerata]|uniref:uncharacterized protein LOC123275371 isoform X2 n=1 Tax=Cotesia glomerata TaxID=32391 RepID=UPI001D035DB7|nr:uncharacterized protein LOC123275371 isoform X2 [Cotesia glomerata]